MHTPPEDIILLIAILAWIKPAEVKEYLEKKESDMMRCLDNDVQRDTWKSHPLYSSNTKSKLEEMCKVQHIPIPSGYSTKHNLVKLLAEKMKDPTSKTSILYSGNLAKVPSTTTGLGKLTVGQLRAILHFHGFPFTGIKEELILLVYLLKTKQTSAMFAREARQLKDLIKLFMILYIVSVHLTLLIMFTPNEHTIHHVLPYRRYHYHPIFQLLKICINCLTQ